MRILVGMSGGIDSTYAAMKLMGEGHEVEGALLVMHEHTDVDSAREAADSIGVRLHVVDCRESFEKVKKNFVDEYCRARTPNPCIICNPTVKFRALAEFALKNGFDRIATGHYAGVVETYDKGEKRYTLTPGKDFKKDQTYMLYRLPQSILSMLVLPLADDVKTDIRETVGQRGLSVADKKDSQEICFIPDGDYAAYIEESVGKFPEGDFIDTDGKYLGRHKGIIRYTVGQRKGLGISLGGRAFVREINALNNTVTLSTEAAVTSLVSVGDMVFTGMAKPEHTEQRRVSVKLRYQAPRVCATAVFDAEGGATLLLDEPARSVTPGQSAVLYDGDILLAGGFITV